MPSNKKIKTPQQLWEDISSIFVNFVEEIFFKLGVKIAKHPWKTIGLTWMFVLLSCFGLVKFYIEKNPMELWVPPESDFYHDTNWYKDNFGTAFRFQKVLITADNVLEPDVLVKIKNITNLVNSIQIKFNNKKYTIQDFCHKVPVVNFLSSNWKTGSEDAARPNATQREQADFTDLTLSVDDEFYCSFLNSFRLACLQYNILDLWMSNIDEIKNLTKHDIVSKVNRMKINPTTGHPTDYTKLLGGTQLDENGDIVAAKSILLTWYTYVNMTEINLNEVGNILGTEDWVTVPLAKWEKKFLNEMKMMSSNEDEIKLFYEAGCSFGEVSGEAMFQDVDKLAIGIIFMFVYVVCAVSRFNWLEIRLTLGSVGLLSVGLAYISAVSWCSIFDVPYGPVHSSLPFLLMGLGVDDMFVMNACWKIVSTSTANKGIPLKVGHMLKHAGVSIVITSFTDIVALLIGAITILPSLKSFCIYAAVGVFFIFCYSVTFYVAVFTLDLQRIEAKRNGILFCCQHNNVSISTEKSISQTILEALYKNVIFTIPGKIFVIIFALFMTGISIEAIFKLEQRFDPKWFVPDDTYYKQFLNTHDLYYPEEGHEALVLLGKMDYKEDFNAIYEMIQDLRNETYLTDVVTWVESVHKYALVNYDRDLRVASNITNEDFNKILSRFLFSAAGGRYQLNLKFEEPVVCGQPASKITASSMSFIFKRFKGPEEYIPAMNNVKKLVKSANISTGDGYRSVWSKAFANWATDEVIAGEVKRNIELALICVMACTVVLITNLQMCFWIFICVLLTIVNVLGWMQRWGMTVDIVCCIGLELAIGLCVDYAAHVGHTFLTLKNGSRSERAFNTVTSIGTAVLLGGGSTFLSLSLLSMSKAYTFQSFFKIFFLVILFGLFNGLVFLPVVLSLVGPGARRSSKEINDTPHEIVELNGKQCDT